MVEPRLERAAEVVERRLEQAAEESRKGAAGVLVRTPAFPGSRRYNKTLSCHSRLLAGGNVLSKPLDSGLRRNDEGVASGFCRAATGFLGGLFPTPLYRLRPVGVPSRRIQDFLGRSFQTPLYHLGRLFQTRLYHLHPCRRTSL